MKSVIIGNSGAGKTYLGRKMASSLGIELFELDKFFWEPGGFNRKRPREVIFGELNSLADQPSWIVEGVFGELAELFLDRADLLIWLDMPWSTCRSSLMARGSESSKQLDPAMAEKNFKNLIDWAENYWQRDDLRSQRGHGSLFERFSRTKYRLVCREQATDFITRQQWKAL